MTNKKMWLGMLVLVLVFGMTVVGCYEQDPPPVFDTRPYFGGTIAIDNRYPVVGETITASFSELPAYPSIGEPSWTWYKTTKEDVTDAQWIIDNATSIGYDSTYTVRPDDAGFWIWVFLRFSGNSNVRDTKTSDTVIGIPSTATVSVSMSAVYYPSRSSENHYVNVTLTLSDGKWDNVPYSTASQWLTMSGTPSVSSWYFGNSTPSVSEQGRKFSFFYWTRSETPLPISNLTATLNTSQLNTMRSNTNVYNTLTAGTTTASVSQWTISD